MSGPWAMNLIVEQVPVDSRKEPRKVQVYLFPVDHVKASFDAAYGFGVPGRWVSGTTGPLRPLGCFRCLGLAPMRPIRAIYTSI
jgi:hypothetical protein